MQDLRCCDVETFAQSAQPNNQAVIGASAVVPAYELDCTPTEIQPHGPNFILPTELDLHRRGTTVQCPATQPQNSIPEPKSAKGHATHPMQPIIGIEPQSVQCCSLGKATMARRSKLYPKFVEGDHRSKRSG